MSVTKVFMKRIGLYVAMWPKAGEAVLTDRRVAGCGTLVPADVGEGAERKEDTNNKHNRRRKFGSTEMQTMSIKAKNIDTIIMMDGGCQMWTTRVRMVDTGTTETNTMQIKVSKVNGFAILFGVPATKGGQRISIMAAAADTGIEKTMRVHVCT